MTNDEKRKRINKGTRWIACAVFKANINKSNYAKGYDKLYSRFFLDYGYSLQDRLKSPENKDKRLFDIVDSNELEMLLQSLYKLETMYSDVLAS